MKNGTFAESIKVGFNSAQAGLLSRLAFETRNEAIEEIERRRREPTPSRTKRILRALFLYGVDMILVVAAWRYAFGLTVQSWAALIAFLFIGRCFWHAAIVLMQANDGQAVLEHRTRRSEWRALTDLLDADGIPTGPIGWRVMEYRHSAESADRAKMITALDQITLMLRDISELADSNPADIEAVESIVRAAKGGV